MKKFMEKYGLTKKFLLGVLAYFIGTLLWGAFVFWVLMSIKAAR